MGWVAKNFLKKIVEQDKAEYENLCREKGIKIAQLVRAYWNSHDLLKNINNNKKK